jgi:hypothetical protein
MIDFWNNVPSGPFANEADVEVRLVIPLLHALGYEDSDIHPKYPVVFQEGRRGRKPEADFVVFYGPLHNKDQSLIVVEAKEPNEPLANGKAQGESYAFNIRAPLLLLTNGTDLEIWQLQVSKESDCILRVSVALLTAERGKIESCLSKPAAYAYCRSLDGKNISEASADFGRYETAELKRTLKYQASVKRTLRIAGSTSEGKPIESDSLLSSFSSGAIILAPSGYGKTTLAIALLRAAIEVRWAGTGTMLPFDVPLPDLAETGLLIVEFMRQRLSAHCPGVSTASLERMLREKGAILICDGFDRLSPEAQRKTDTALRNLTRDFPLLQVFILSRGTSKPILSLPVLLLQALSTDQQHEFAQLFAIGLDPEAYLIISMMPELLRGLCTNPLLLQLALEYWRVERQFPGKIDSLFRSWLDRILRVDTHDNISAIQREGALTVISEASATGSINNARAISLLKQHGYTESVLDDLIRCDAVRVSGSLIEVEHEALADYLRACRVVSGEQVDIPRVIAAMSLDADSLLPVLLMALLPSLVLQRALWTRLAQAGLPVYLNALRYRRDVSGELATIEPDQRAEHYLRDLIDGIELPLNGLFPQLRWLVTEHLIGVTGETLAITGIAHAKPAGISYALHPLSSSGARVTVASPLRENTICYVNLDLSGYRLDSGRLLGMTTLRDAILQITEQHRLRGGRIWANERLIGRLRYLAKEYGFAVHNTDSLDVIEAALKPNADEIVQAGAFSHSITFPISELLEDIALLRKEGKTSLDLWWMRLGWDPKAGTPNKHVLEGVLDEHYRRIQHVYAEIVQNSFSSIANNIGFYSGLPVRWRLTVTERAVGSTRHLAIFYEWLPVVSWDKAGADVIFSDKPPEPRDLSSVQNELAKLGRLHEHSHIWGGFTVMQNFEGYRWNGQFDGATSVAHDVCGLISREIETTFSSLPSQDVARSLWTRGR